MPHRSLKVTRDARALTPSASGAVTSVGVFDGVHLGHQSILAANVARAAELGPADEAVAEESARYGCA